MHASPSTQPAGSTAPAQFNDNPFQAKPWFRVYRAVENYAPTYQEHLRELRQRLPRAWDTWTKEEREATVDQLRRGVAFPVVLNWSQREAKDFSWLHDQDPDLARKWQIPPPLRPAGRRPLGAEAPQPAQAVQPVPPTQQGSPGPAPSVQPVVAPVQRAPVQSPAPAQVPLPASRPSAAPGAGRVLWASPDEAMRRLFHAVGGATAVTAEGQRQGLRTVLGGISANQYMQFDGKHCTRFDPVSHLDGPALRNTLTGKLPDGGWIMAWDAAAADERLRPFAAALGKSGIQGILGIKQSFELLQTLQPPSVDLGVETPGGLARTLLLTGHAQIGQTVSEIGQLLCRHQVPIVFRPFPVPAAAVAPAPISQEIPAALPAVAVAPAATPAPAAAPPAALPMVQAFHPVDTTPAPVPTLPPAAVPMAPAVDQPQQISRGGAPAAAAPFARSPEQMDACTAPHPILPGGGQPAGLEGWQERTVAVSAPAAVHAGDQVEVKPQATAAPAPRPVLAAAPRVIPDAAAIAHLRLRLEATIADEPTPVRLAALGEVLLGMGMRHR